MVHGHGDGGGQLILMLILIELEASETSSSPTDRLHTRRAGGVHVLDWAALAPKFPILPLTARGLMTCAHPAGRDHARSERKVAGSIRTTKANAAQTVPSNMSQHFW